MRHVWTVGMACLAVLLAMGSIEARLMPDSGSAEWNRKVAVLSGNERDLIRRIDIVDCREGVVAGREAFLAASDSREGRRELARRPELVSRFCECRFEASSQLLTRYEFAKLWLGRDASAGVRVRSSAGTDAALPARELGRVARDCAEAVGLHTLPEETDPAAAPDLFGSGASLRMTQGDVVSASLRT